MESDLFAGHLRLCNSYREPLSSLLRPFLDKSVRCLTVAAEVSVNSDGLDTFVNALAALCDLAEVDLSRCSMDEHALFAMLSAISSRPVQQVHTLRLQHSPFCNALLAKVTFQLASVTELNVSDTPLTDDAALLCNAFPALQCLCLRNSRVQGRSVGRLIDRMPLRELNVDECFNFEHSADVLRALRARKRSSIVCPLRMSARGVAVTADAVDLLSFCAASMNRRTFVVLHDLLQAGEDHQALSVDKFKVQLRFNGGEAIDVVLSDVVCTLPILHIAKNAIEELNVICCAGEQRKLHSSAQKRRNAFRAALLKFEGTPQRFALGTVSLHHVSKLTGAGWLETDFGKRVVGNPVQTHRLLLSVEAEARWHHCI